MLPTETRKQNFLSCNSMKKNKCKNNNVLFSPIILSSTMPWPRRTVRTGLSEIQMVQKRPGLVWSILTVNIEHECVLDGLERHEGVQGLAPQCPPMVCNAGSKVKQGEIILLKSCNSYIWYGWCWWYVSMLPVGMRRWQCLHPPGTTWHDLISSIS